MSNTLTTINATAEDMYKIGDTLRITDSGLTTWWEMERPFFPVPIQEKCAVVEWMTTDGGKVALSISDTWKTEWSMRVLWI